MTKEMFVKQLVYNCNNTNNTMVTITIDRTSSTTDNFCYLKDGRYKYCIEYLMEQMMYDYSTDASDLLDNAEFITELEFY